LNIVLVNYCYTSKLDGKKQNGFVQRLIDFRISKKKLSVEELFEANGYEIEDTDRDSE